MENCGVNATGNLPVKTSGGEREIKSFTSRTKKHRHSRMPSSGNPGFSNGFKFEFSATCSMSQIPRSDDAADSPLNEPLSNSLCKGTTYVRSIQYVFERITRLK
jgi:hypothetical protein